VFSKILHKFQQMAIDVIVRLAVTHPRASLILARLHISSLMKLLGCECFKGQVDKQENIP